MCSNKLVLLFEFRPHLVEKRQAGFDIVEGDVGRPQFLQIDLAIRPWMSLWALSKAAISSLMLSLANFSLSDFLDDARIGRDALDTADAGENPARRTRKCAGVRKGSSERTAHG